MQTMKLKLKVVYVVYVQLEHYQQYASLFNIGDTLKAFLQFGWGRFVLGIGDFSRYRREIVIL